MSETILAHDGDNGANHPAARTIEDGVNWRSYVEGTRTKYVDRYVSFAQQNTSDYSRLEGELANLMNSARQAEIQKTARTVLLMAEWLWSSGGQFLDVRGHFREGLQLLTQAVNAARLLGDKSQEGHITGQLGRVSMALRNWPTATEYFQQALAIARAIGDLQGQASHLGNLGQIHLELAQTDSQEENQLRATDCFQAAITIAREIGDRQTEGRLLGSLGLVKLRSQMSVGYSRERMIEAIEHLDGAIAIARETGDRRGEASHLGSIGGAYELMGSMHVSIPPFVGGSPYPLEEADRRERYAKELEQADGKSYLEAYEYYSHALSIAREVGDEQMQKGLADSLASAASKAKLPVYPDGVTINMNWWARGSEARNGDPVPGTRYLRNQPPIRRKPGE